MCTGTSVPQGAGLFGGRPGPDRSRQVRQSTVAGAKPPRMFDSPKTDLQTTLMSQIKAMHQATHVSPHSGMQAVRWFARCNPNPHQPQVTRPSLAPHLIHTSFSRMARWKAGLPSTWGTQGAGLHVVQEVDQVLPPALRPCRTKSPKGAACR